MHDLITYHIPEAVHIYVQALNENGQSLLDDRSGRAFAVNQFSVDPQITNFAVLESIIVKAFNLNGDYILTYLNRSLNEYVQLKSDWDLENAYLGNAKPHLDIRVQKTSVSNLTDWDIVSASDLNRVATYAGKQTSQLANNFLNRMEKMVFKAFNKPQFEGELDENSNVASNQPAVDVEKRKSNFNAFNLFKFKRRPAEQPIPAQQHSSPLQPPNKPEPAACDLSSGSLSQGGAALHHNHSNPSTSSIRSSKFSFTKKDLAKRHTIHKRDLKTAVGKMKRISSVQAGDNLILRNILGKVNTSKASAHEPLTEQQYLKYLHPDGRVRCLRELRLAIYRRGIESSLRSTLWKHLLNVYPPNLTSEQRVRFCQQKADQYYQLCFTWQRSFAHPKVQQIHNQVRKDVLRTDRSHPFYVSKVNMDSEQQNDITSSVSTYSSILTQFDAKTSESSMNSSQTAPSDYCSTDAQTGIDQQVGVYENRNVQALTNVLTTYALNHQIGYWQGMSDLCSPILLAIQNEADTYICFTALMRRLSANFNGDECMANKFDLLRKLVQHYDPEFFDYLEQQQASDLLFCYRWLLLELKREFKLDHSLYMLEVSYAAMPPKFYPDLPMYDRKFVPNENEPKDESKGGTLKSAKLGAQPAKSLPTPVRRDAKPVEKDADAESVNSSKTLSNSLTSGRSAKGRQPGNAFSRLKEERTNHGVQDNLKNLTSEVTSAASDLGKQLTNFGVSGVNQIKKSVNGVANVASEFYDKLNASGDHHRSSRSTFRDLKLSSVEEQLACKREKFHQQNTTGHSVSSLNEMRFSLDQGDSEGSRRKSKNSSLNGSNHSLIEYNNTLNYILNKTQAMLRQQEQKFSNSFSFGLNGRKDSAGKEFAVKESNRGDLKCTKQHQRHIRFLPKILSTDSNNAIDSPENDDLNEKLNFPHLMNKQFSIDSVDSLEFNLQPAAESNPAAAFSNNGNSNNSNLNSFIGSTGLFKGATRTSTASGQFNNFTCFSNFNNLPSFTSGLPFTKQNSIPQANLLKQQLKQSINQQSHIYHLKQRSLPSSPLFKKKLDSFERPFLPFLQNQLASMLDRHVSEHSTNPTAHSTFGGSMNGQMSGQTGNQVNGSTNGQINSAQKPSSCGHSSGNLPSTGLPPSCYSANRTKRSKLISNQFDSFDQRDLFVHCNGENSESSSTYNSNWRPERGLLNCFDSASFDAGSNGGNGAGGSHQRLARQLSDKLINEKMHGSAARQSSCEERPTMDAKKLIGHTQSANACQSAGQSTSGEFRALSGQLTKLNGSLSNSAANGPAHGSVNEPPAEQSGQYLKATAANSSNSSATYEKEERSEGYCSGSISDRNSNYEEPGTNLESELIFTNTFSNSTSSLKSSHSSSSSTSSISSSLSCSSSLVILSSNTSFRSKIAQIEKLSGCLPSPNELGASNAFMLFICLTILLLHRDKIINENLDANDIAIYFDSKIRKHDVHLVVNLARELFQVYLNKWQGYQLVSSCADQSVLDSILDGKFAPDH